MRLSHNCACAQCLVAVLGQSSRRGNEPPVPPHIHVLSPGAIHGTGPTVAELGTEILMWGTGTQHDTCPTPILWLSLPPQEKSP